MAIKIESFKKYSDSNRGVNTLKMSLNNNINLYFVYGELAGFTIVDEKTGETRAVVKRSSKYKGRRSWAYCAEFAPCLSLTTETTTDTEFKDKLKEIVQKA